MHPPKTEILTMKLEEALPLLRLGKKIRPYNYPKDEYLMACKVTLDSQLIDLESDPAVKEWLQNQPISIVWMKGDRQHPNMKPSLDPNKIAKECNHGWMPQINIFLLIRDDWEVIE